MDTASSSPRTADPISKQTQARDTSPLGRLLPGPLRGMWATAGRLSETLSVKTKMAVILFLAMILPAAAFLAVAESDAARDTSLYLGVHLAVSLAFLRPLAGLCSRFLVLGDIRAINTFCMEVKRGNYAVRFDLPVEDEDEHDLLRLKRNLDWMTHLIGSREMRLRAELQKTDTTKKRFEELSLRDPLTGLGNRRLFETRIRELARRARQGGSGFHLMLLDCDNFKRVNDVHGHQVGDSVLTLLGSIIRESVREGEDAGFRLGGDEFAVLLPSRDDAAARVVGERIRTRFAAAQDYGCTLSLGATAYRHRPETDMEDDLRELVARSDKAVYTVKHDGGNRVRLVRAGIDPKSLPTS